MRPSLLLAVLVPSLLLGPVAGAASAQSAPSAAPTATESPAAVVESPAATPTATTTPRPGAPVAPQVTASTPQSLSGDPVVVTARATPGQQVDLYAYTRPSTTLRRVRSGVAAPDGTVAWTLLLPASTRVVARSGELTGAPLVLPVAWRLSLTAVPDDACTVYSGRVLPAAAGAGGVSLVRVVDERNVLLGRAPVGADGRYGLRRCEPGYTGDLTVTARLAPTLTAVPGPAPVLTQHCDGCQGLRPGADVVVDVDQPAPARSVVLERGQGLLLKVSTNPSTGYSIDTRRVGRGLVGPQRSFVADPVPAGSGPLAGGPGGRRFLRFVGAGAGSTTLTVLANPPGDQASERLVVLRVTVR